MQSRRKFLKKALYTAPVILTVAVRPSFAGSGYGTHTGGSGGGNVGGNTGVEFGGPDTVNPPNLGGGPSTKVSHSGGHGGHYPWWEFWRNL